MNTVFSNIQQALTESDFNFFVISDNEIHSFETIEKANEDAEWAAHKGINVEVVDRETAKAQYL